jgi:hypothetical protein
LKYNSSDAVISTFVDELPSRKWGDLIGRQREHVEITCPAIVSVYSSHMGNVDLLNIIQGEFTLRWDPKNCILEFSVTWLIWL